MSSPLKMTMPMPHTSSPQPTAPIDANPLNNFSQFFRSEDLNSSLPYPTISQHFYFLKLDIKRDWHAGMAIKDSPVLTSLANEIESELKNLLGTDETFKIFVVHAQKDRFSSRRILMTIVMQTLLRFDVEKLEKMLTKHMKKEEKIMEVRAYARDLKVKKIQSDEFEHLKNYGCNPCDICGEFGEIFRNLSSNFF